MKHFLKVVNAFMKYFSGLSESVSAWLGMLCFLILAVPGLIFADTKADSPRPVILSAAEIDYPPFSLVDEAGRASGFSVELLRAALETMGYGVTFRTGLWPEVRQWLEKGEIQALPLVGRTPERETLFDFTFPFMSLHGAIVVREGTTGIRSLADLEGRQVAVMKGDNAEEFLQRKDQGLEIVTRPTFEVALKELADGHYDAVFIQRLVALRLIQEGGITGLEVVRFPVEEFRQEFCFGVREGDRQTLALLNEGLSLVMADGTYRRLHAKWFAAMELPSNRPVVVGGDHDYPPFEYLDESGRPAGFMVELTRAIAREMNMDVQIRLGPWDETVQALEDGEIDVIQGMFYSVDRDRVFDFSPSHLVSYYVGVTTKDRGDPPKSLEDLSGKRLAVQKGDVVLDFLAEKGVIGDICLKDTQQEVLQAVSDGQCDSAVVPRICALYLMAQNDWSGLVLGNTSFFTGEYAYAVKKGRPAVLAQFSEGLKLLEQTGEYRRIQARWLGMYQEELLPLARVLRYSAMVVVPLVLVLVVMFLWSRALRRQVALKTRELYDSSEFQRAMVACSPVALYSVDVVGKVTEWNDSAEKMFGWTAEEVMGQRLPIVPENKTHEFEELQHQVLENGVVTGVELVRQKKDGTFLDISLSAAPIHDFQGRIMGVMGAVEDITRRKQAREHIQHLNQVLRAVRDINQLIVHEQDKDALIREGCRLLVAHRGYPSAVILLVNDRNFPVSWAMSGLSEESDALEALFEQGQIPLCCQTPLEVGKTVLYQEPKTTCRDCPVSPGCAGKMAACVPLCHQRQIFGYLIVSLERFIAEGDEEYLLLNEMGQDFAYALSTLEIETAREKLQAQLNQAQKMESVGRLAGGVAHDFNNMLNVIIGYAELGQTKITLEDPLYTDFEEILNAARRSSDIIRQLLAFARKQTIQPRVLDLNEVIEGTLKMLRRLIGEQITLFWHPGPHLCPVYMDTSQVDQILANLLVNAKDAIDGVGKITIETRNISLDESYCETHEGFKPGDFVLLSVSDDGSGMDRHTLEKLFEPFFSTKAKSKGTGLGLATVYGIVKQNNGFINVYSEPGCGASFKIFLPCHGEPVVKSVEDQELPIPQANGETLLIVEDEKAILTLTRKVLENLGYQVVAVPDPLEALDWVQQHDTEIHLLLTDVVMPQMNGLDLSKQLQKKFPDIRILYMSGYTANVIAHHGILDTGVHFIQKPFASRDLAVKIRAVLDGKGD